MKQHDRHQQAPTQQTPQPQPPLITKFWNIDHGSAAPNTPGYDQWGVNTVTGIRNTQETFNANYAEASAKYQAAMTAYWADFQAAAKAREDAAG